ncbi:MULTISPECIES: GtrA family protein [Saccharopolyspora]|uniref:GtrA family protein n=2 Tax=Saccharopolyspora TaxID=1835 RepID=A0A4R4VZM5_9PSEU|nr:MULTISPECIES: GtrA family protein [Saccharopolyspora]MBQ0928671.1 GtrA family protein [Saccharopolyspora endophytica]TDD08055.1 GtrA family protein [Saccharopolyspora terrae]
MTKLEPRSRLISRELLLYAVIGGSGVLLDYLLFLVLFNYFGMHHQLANALSTTAGITNNFVLNSLFNFRKTDRILVRFLRFYAVGIAGIVLTFLLLAVFSTWLGIDANLVKLASLPVVLLFQYTINKRWSFG